MNCLSHGITSPLDTIVELLSAGFLASVGEKGGERIMRSRSGAPIFFYRCGLCGDRGLRMNAVAKEGLGRAAHRFEQPLAELVRALFERSLFVVHGVGNMGDHA